VAPGDEGLAVEGVERRHRRPGWRAVGGAEIAGGTCSEACRVACRVTASSSRASATRRPIIRVEASVVRSRGRRAAPAGARRGVGKGRPPESGPLPDGRRSTRISKRPASG
jgi:hypothetical protein